MSQAGAQPALSGDGPIGRALAALDRGDLARAAMLAARETATAPDDAMAWEILSLAAYWRGALTAALAAAGEAAALTPDSARRQSALGTVLLACGQADAAESAFAAAVAADSAHAPGRQGLAERLLARGRTDEAEANFAAALISSAAELAEPRLARWALAPAPRAQDLHAAIGACRLARADLGGAQASLDRALAIDPGHGWANALAARIMEADGRPFAALGLHQRAIAAAPTDATLAAEAAGLLHGLGQFQAAEAMARGALALAPGDGALASARLRRLADHPERCGEALLREHDDWAASLPGARRPPIADRSADPDRPLRLGIMVGDATGALTDHVLTPLLAGVDRRAFQIIAYVDCAAGAAPPVLEANAVCGRPIAGLSDEAIAGRVEGDAVDILLDLAGHAPGGRPGVFAHRPAPLQAALVSGLDSAARGPLYDAVMAGAEISADGAAAFFARTQLTPLAGAGLALTLDDRAPITAWRAPGEPVFGYVGRPERLNAHVLAAWAEVLRRAPRARLLIGLPGLGEPAFRALVQRRLAEAGAPADRLMLAATPTADTARNARAAIDVALDPFPHSDGAAALAVLARGVPVVALRGEAPFGRAAASILQAGGLGDWAADDREAYVAKAVAAAGGGAAADRGAIMRTLAGSSLCDGPAFAGRIGDALLALWMERRPGASAPQADRRAA